MGGFLQNMKKVADYQISGISPQKRKDLCRPGAVARLETSGDLGSRLTVTRLATLGFVGLGTKKKTGSYYITIEQDGAVVYLKEIKNKKAVEVSLRRWIIDFNNEVRHQEREVAPDGDELSTIQRDLLGSYTY